MTAPAETTFAERLGQLAAEDPEKTAYTCGEQSISRGDLDRSTTRLARTMAGTGVGQDQLVTIGLPNGIAFLQACFAAWKLGATPQPVNHRLPAPELAALLEVADPALVVGLPGQGRPELSLAALERACQGDGDEPALERAFPTSWKAPTSGGSTGRPKLIIATQPAIYEQTVLGFAALYRIEPGDRQLVPGPLSHNGPFMLATLGLLAGSEVTIMERFDAEAWLTIMDQQKITWTYAVPTMMKRALRLPTEVRDRHHLESLRVIYHLAEPCPEWVKQGWIDWVGPDTVWELYAGTEAQAVTALSGTQWLAHRGSVGPAVIGEITVRLEDGSEPAPGEPGLVWMRRGAGEPVPYRYVGATATGLGEGWETLGDIGRLDADGYLYLVDRASDMFTSGGRNVYPAEVEAVAGEFPGVRSVAMIGLPDDDLGSRGHLIIETETMIDDAELLDYLKARLSAYKLPRTVERTDEPLRDEAGKLRRGALRAARLA